MHADSQQSTLVDRGGQHPAEVDAPEVVAAAVHSVCSEVNLPGYCPVKHARIIAEHADHQLSWATCTSRPTRTASHSHALHVTDGDGLVQARHHPICPGDVSNLAEAGGAGTARPRPSMTRLFLAEGEPSGRRRHRPRVREPVTPLPLIGIAGVPQAERPADTPRSRSRDVVILSPEDPRAGR